MTFASGVKSVKVKSAPAGVTVAGGVKGGKLAVAVVRPRGASASGKVVLTLTGKAKGAKTVAAALDGGKAPSCAGPRQAARQAPEGHGGREGPRRRARREAVRQARAGQRGRRPRASSGSAPPPAPPAPPAPAGLVRRRRRPPRRRRRAPRPTPTPPPPAGKACGNGADDDNDGQTDLEDPGCADGNDTVREQRGPGLAGLPRQQLGRRHGRRPERARRGHQRLRPVHEGAHRRRPGRRVVRRSSPAAATGSASRRGAYGVATAKDGKAVDTADVQHQPHRPRELRPPGDDRALSPQRRGRRAARPDRELQDRRRRRREAGVRQRQGRRRRRHDRRPLRRRRDRPGPRLHVHDGHDRELGDARAAGTCKIELGLWDETGDIAGATAEGCGGLRASGTTRRAP